MSDPVRLLAFVLASAVAALALLFFAPVFLLVYGWPLAWAWVSVLISWVFVDCLHGYFEEHEFETDAQRRTVEQLRTVRREHDQHGVGTSGPDDRLLPLLERLAAKGYLEVERYPDGDAWWRAAL